MDSLTIVLQDAPYGSEKAYNAFRYISALLATHGTVYVFLLADGGGVAKRGQKTSTGYYNTATMLADLIAKGVKVKTCGTRCAASGLDQEADEWRASASAAASDCANGKAGMGSQFVTVLLTKFLTNRKEGANHVNRS